MTGFISFQPGQPFIRIAQDKFIYSYKFDDQEFIPHHHSTIVNFSQSSNMFFDNKDLICLMFQENQPNIFVFFRKFMHNFNHLIDSESKEDVDCANLAKEKAFLVSDDDYFKLYCSRCFTKIYRKKLPLVESKTDDKMEILSMKVSECQNYVAFIAGKNLIKEQEELYQILIYQINSRTQFDFIFELKLNEEYRNYSKTF